MCHYKKTPLPAVYNKSSLTKFSEQQNYEPVSLNEQIECKFFHKATQNVSFSPSFVSANVRGIVFVCVCVVRGCKIVGNVEWGEGGGYETRGVN